MTTTDNPSEPVKTKTTQVISAETRAFYAAVRKGLPKGAFLRRDEIIRKGRAACPALHVKALCAGIDGNQWASIVKFQNPNRELVECEIPWSLLHGKPRDAIALLADRGLRMTGKVVGADVLDLIRSWPHQAQAHDVLLKGIGWTPDRNVFAFSSGKVLSRVQTGPNYRLSGGPSGKEIGDLKTWREGIAALSIGNPYLIFAISASFAAPLVPFTRLNTTIFHLYGKTSLGKTRALSAALSTMPRIDDVPKAWTATGNALESEIAASHGTLAVFDELPLDKKLDVWSAIYRLANGSEKGRSNKDGSAKQRVSWQTMILSAGEFPSDIVLKEMGRTKTGGQDARMVDIPVRGKHGAFDALHGHPDGHSFLGALDDAIASTSGPAGEAFVQALLNNTDDSIKQHVKAQIRIEGSALWDALGLADQSFVPNEIMRVIDSFALVVVAGKIATKFGLTGWSVESVLEAVHLITRRWLEQCETAHSIDIEVIEKTRAVIQQHQARFFQFGEQTEDPAGYCDDDYFYLLPKTFAGIHGKSRKATTDAANQLEQAGILHPGGERNSYMFKLSARVPSRPRVYRISREILNSAPQTA